MNKHEIEFVVEVPNTTLKPSACDQMKGAIKKRVLEYFKTQTQIKNDKSWQENFLRSYNVNSSDWEDQNRDSAYFIELTDWIANEITEEALIRRSFITVQSVMINIRVDLDRTMLKVTNNTVG